MRWRGVIRYAPWVLLAIVLLLAGGLAREHIRGATALERWRQAMRTRGEKLDLAELAPPPPAGKRGLNPGQIETLLRWGELRSLQCQGDDWRYRCALPGRAVVVWRDAPDDQVPWGTNTWSDLEAHVASAPALARHILETLRQRDWVLAPDYAAGPSMRVIDIFGYINAAQGFALATVVALRANRGEDARDFLLATLTLPQACEEGGSFIESIGRMAATGIAFHPTWQALQASDWTEPDLLELQAAWQHAQFLEDMIRCLELERAFWRHAVFDLARRDLRAGMRALAATGADLSPGGSDSALLDLLSRGVPGFERFRASLGEARLFTGACLWRVAWIDADEAFYCQALQEQIDVARRRLAVGQGRKDATPNPAPTAPLFEQLFRMRGIDAVRHGVSRHITPRISTATDEAVRLEVMRAMTVTAIALKRYRLRHGHWPAALAALVPEFLPALPVDFADGAPLRYRVTEDDSFTLYSVGGDGRDDGGDIRPGESKASLSWPCDGRDWVWPRPATVAELRATPERPLSR